MLKDIVCVCVCVCVFYVHVISGFKLLTLHEERQELVDLKDSLQ